MIIKYQASKFDLSYVGRNGRGIQKGIELLAVGEPSLDQVVMVSPINSKDMVAHCSVDVPVKDIPELVKQLNLIHQNAVNTAALTR